jgi:hypothetical protein
VDVSVTTGTSASLLYVLQALPSLVSGSMLSPPHREGRIPVPVHRLLRLEEW